MSAPAPIHPGAAALVVDDSAAMRHQIVTALRQLLGLACDEACDGAEGWRKLAAGTYDIVLTDVNMPIMDGLKLIALARAARAHRTTPIVVISAAGAQADRDRGLALGADAYLVKPVRAQELAATVRRLLTR